MKHAITHYPLAILLAIICTLGTHARTVSPRGKTGRKYRLVWKERFRNQSDLEGNWSKISRGMSDWNRHMSEDSRLYGIRRGKLILRGTNNDGSFLFAGKKDTARFVTGGLFTKGKRSIRYGKVEIRARLNCAQGAWPALWMLPEEGGWPDGGEIDIMEHLNHDSIVYQTVHSHYTYVLREEANPPHGGTGAIRPGKFNTYTVEILPDSLVFSINGKSTFSYPRIETDKPGQYPFGTPFHLLIDMQIEGSWVGKARPDQLPVEMEIDWVRMYETQGH